MTTQPPGVAQAFPGLVHIEDLTRHYRSVAALQDFTPTLGVGHIVGLMGPNGCGKTVLLKTLAGVLSDYEGSVIIDGYHLGPVSKSIVSYLPDADFLNPGWNVRTAITEYSRFFADFNADKAAAMADFYGLPTTRPLSSMSKGMGEKLQIALTMARQACVYSPDEPISGVDPATCDVMLGGILRELNISSLLIMPTHLISDIEHFVDHAFSMKEGRVFLRMTSATYEPRGETPSTQSSGRSTADVRDTTLI